jgi:hypothetical protein
MTASDVEKQYVPASRHRRRSAHSSGWPWAWLLTAWTAAVLLCAGQVHAKRGVAFVHGTVAGAGYWGPGFVAGVRAGLEDPSRCACFGLDSVLREALQVEMGPATPGDAE